jgi:hypothetical protein
VNRVFVCVIALAVWPTGVSSSELQTFDPLVLGRATSEPVKLLLDKSATGDVEPYVIWADVRCSRYIGASVFYRAPVSMADGRRALDKLYARHALPSKAAGEHRLWRVEERRFAVQLVDHGSDGISIIYLHFAPLSVVWKGMMEAQGFEQAAKTVKEADCSDWEAVFAPSASPQPW